LYYDTLSLQQDISTAARHENHLQKETQDEASMQLMLISLFFFYLCVPAFNLQQLSTS